MLATVLVPAVAHAQETTEYYGTDVIGSIRVVWDANGNVLARQDYAPFGKPLFPVTGMPKQGFGGQDTDGETDQGYFHARMYQARTGRFNRPDPVQAGFGDPQQWNRYAYARNNGVSNIDPTGLVVFTGKSNPGCKQFPADCGSSFWIQLQLWWYLGGDGSGGSSYSGGAVGGATPTTPTTPATDPGSDPDPNPNPNPNPPGGNPPGGDPPGGDPPPRYPGDSSPSGNSFVDKLRCAANLANVASIAGAVRSDSFLVQTFAGNDFSTLASALVGDRRSAAQIAISNPAELAGAPVNLFGAFLTYAPVGPRAKAVFGHNGYVERFARIPLAETRAATLLPARMVGALSGIKLLYDAGTFVGAAAACSF
jgi:RHS repeat-associated protein